jgi:hypothetical protein
MRDRTFGVEIECGVDSGSRTNDSLGCVCEWDEETQSWWPEGDPDGHCASCCGCGESEYGDGGCEFAAEVLASAGFRNWLYDIHPDGSGVEIPSPVLRGQAGLEELREVMELLKRNGFYTAGADGMHVHHDASDLLDDTALMARLVEMWEENLPQINKLVHPHRVNNHYCASRMESSPDAWDVFKRDKNLDAFSSSRFYGMAIRDATIEFRLHQGTLDFEKASAWVHFGQEFIELAKRKATAVTCSSAIQLLRTTGTSRKATRTLLVKATA